MATSRAVPQSCPACGWTFGLLDIQSQQAHYLAHLLTLALLERADRALPDHDASTDW